MAIIYPVPARDPETKERMERAERLVCFVDGQEREVVTEWPDRETMAAMEHKPVLWPFHPVCRTGEYRLDDPKAKAEYERLCRESDGFDLMLTLMQSPVGI